MEKKRIKDRMQKVEAAALHGSTIEFMRQWGLFKEQLGKYLSLNDDDKPIEIEEDRIVCPFCGEEFEV